MAINNDAMWENTKAMNRLADAMQAPTRELIETLLTHNAALQREVDMLKANHASQQKEIVKLQREVESLWAWDGTEP